MVDEKQPAIDSPPCVKCGTTKGHTPKGRRTHFRALGRCHACYQRYRRHGPKFDDPPVPAKQPKQKWVAEQDRPPCLRCGTTRGHTVAGRQRPFRGKGLCYACYKRRNSVEHATDDIAGFTTDPHVGWPFGRIPKGGDPADDPQYQAALKQVREEHYAEMGRWNPSDKYLLRQKQYDVKLWKFLKQGRKKLP